MQNINTWKTMNVIKDAIISHNGYIYGGFVRDSILHDHNAKLFFEKCPESMDDNIDRVLYNDPNILPETKDRLLIPSDIDCFMTDKEFNLFINKLKDIRLAYKTLFIRAASEYLKGFPNNDVSLLHRKICIHVDTKHFLTELDKLPFIVDRYETIKSILSYAPPSIVVDVITSVKQYNEPFFTDVDFECNGLYLSKHGLSVSKSILSDDSIYGNIQKINSIIENIIDKKAIYLHPFNTENNIGKRTEKLLNKGWTIQDTLKVVTSINDEHYDGHCIICHETLPKTHYKFTCCDARYHRQCIKKVIKNIQEKKKCIMCNTIIPIVCTHYFLFDEPV